jgi:hypothetical protein
MADSPVARQAVLVFVGSVFALGSGGMYFYWRREGRASDEIRPLAIAVERGVIQPPLGMLYQ